MSDETPTPEEVEVAASAVSLKYGMELADRPPEHQAQFRRDAYVTLMAVRSWWKQAGITHE